VAVVWVRVHLYTYIYIYIYVCACVWIHIYIYIHIHICIYMYIHICRKWSAWVLDSRHRGSFSCIESAFKHTGSHLQLRSPYIFIYTCIHKYVYTHGMTNMTYKHIHKDLDTYVCICNTCVKDLDTYVCICNTCVKDLDTYVCICNTCVKDLDTYVCIWSTVTYTYICI